MWPWTPARCSTGPGGRLGLPEPAAAGADHKARSALGPGPPQHPGDGRLQQSPAAGLLQAQRPDRGRARSQRGELRIAGPAHAGRRRGVAGHQDGQGPLAYPQPFGRALAGRSGTGGPGHRGRPGPGGVLGPSRVGGAGLGRGHRRPGRPRDRVVLPVGPLHQGRRGRAHMRPVGRPNVGGGDRGHGRPLRRLRPGRAPDPGYRGRAGRGRRNGRPPPTGPWRTARWP